MLEPLLCKKTGAGGLLLQLYVLSSSLEEVLEPLLCEKTGAGWPTVAAVCTV